MPTKLITCATTLLVAGSIAACGSSTSSTSQTTTSTTTTTAAPAQSGTTHKRKLSGTTGRKLTVAAIAHFALPKRRSQHAHLSGLPSNLTFEQKLNVFLNNIVPFWQQVFTTAGGKLPPATAVLIQDQSASCGSTQLTSSSAPAYCPMSDTLFFPSGSISANLVPLGDAALLLMTSDLYSYHVENALGAFSKSYSAVQLKEMDSCLSGVFFSRVAGALGAQDESSVNAYLAQQAQTVGTSAGTGGVSADDLSTAFNKGFTATVGGMPHPQACTPS
jgi:hypothetical protein